MNTISQAAAANKSSHLEKTMKQVDEVLDSITTDLIDYRVSFLPSADSVTVSVELIGIGSGEFKIRPRDAERFSALPLIETVRQQLERTLYRIVVDKCFKKAP